MIGAMFNKFGVRVNYSEVDGDDTLASYAQHYGASILSRDKDFLRYNGSTFTIYEDYILKKEKIHLKKRMQMTHHQIGKQIAKRDLILNPLPDTYHHFPAVDRLKRHPDCFRGNPSPLTKKLGNLHTKIRYLRAQFYFELGLQKTIVEKIPEWN